MKRASRAHITMRLFLIGTLLLGVASAVRVEPGADASSGASALRSEVAAVDVEFSSSESETSPTRALTDASSAVGLTDACDAAYKILNSNKGYNDAISAVFDQARVVGKAAGEECVKHLSPSASPLGGTCTENAHKYWTAEKMALIAPLELACMEVLPPEEVAPVVWLDEVVITNSPLSILPWLGLELKLGGILPIYVPASCRNEPDMASILAYFDDSCVKEDPNLHKCRFSVYSL